MVFNQFLLPVLISFSIIDSSIPFLISFSINVANNCNLYNFRTSGLVPDKIPKIPENSMKIEYEDVSVICGNVLSRASTQDPPKVIEYPSDKNKLYTLLMFDPDVLTPENPNVADFRHWLVENIPGDYVKSGDVVSPYFPTHPGTKEPHRYTFVVYEQPDGKKLDDDFPNDPPPKRTHFDHQKFIEERNLTGPIAGNFFYCHE